MEYIAAYLEDLAQKLRNGEIEIKLRTTPLLEEFVDVNPRTGETVSYSGKPLEGYYTEELTISPKKSILSDA